MPKRKETLEIENKLHIMCQKECLYGCEEVTIGFYNNGHGDEVVDFCTMNSKGELRCYEIKVTLADLKSKAKKSWYGHYNYLIVTKELFEKISDNLEQYIPDYVGVGVCGETYSYSLANYGYSLKRKAKKQNLTKEQELMLKESMVRSMSYKLQKYREAVDIQKVSELKNNLRKCEKVNQQYHKDTQWLRYVLRKVERILRDYYDKDIDLEETVKNIEDRKMLLPESISLTLTKRGHKINQYIREDNERI